MFTLPELPYTYNALEPYIDEQTMKIHHGKHHAAYVQNLNDALSGHDKYLNMPVEELLKNLPLVPDAIRTKVRNNGGGHANHTFFWSSMTAGKSEPTGELVTAINTTFGSLLSFEEVFAKAGLGRFGSGWVWLIIDHGKLTIMDTPNQDSPLMEHKTPLLGLDVWEHAYYLQYQNRRIDYIKQWWNVVNWPVVQKRFAEATA